MKTARTIVALSSGQRAKSSTTRTAAEAGLARLTDADRIGDLRFVGYATPQEQASTGYDGPCAVYEADYDTT